MVTEGKLQEVISQQKQDTVCLADGPCVDDQEYRLHSLGDHYSTSSLQ